MALALPDGHPRAAPGSARAGAPRARVGVINIMPRLEAYERYLLAPLAAAADALAVTIEPVFIQLGSHAYQSSDRAHLAQHYRPFADALAAGPLAALILTGAPVEELAYPDVHYYGELVDVLRHARAHVGCTLGLCWGGMLLAHLAGVGKRTFARKLFGVFTHAPVHPGGAAGDLVPAAGFPCAHSRHSGLVEADVDAAVAAGALRVVARGERVGTTIVETTDGRLVGHLGHPEYEAERLAFEWHRDRAAGRADVDPPEALDPDAPVTTWAGHRDRLFTAVIARGLAARAAR